MVKEPVTGINGRNSGRKVEFPTGAGKRVCKFDIKRRRRDQKVAPLFISYRIECIDQLHTRR